LCFADITFTNLTGFLFLKKENAGSYRKQISRHMLFDSMKTSLLLAQN
jgi:hypothetical protein